MVVLAEAIDAIDLFPYASAFSPKVLTVMLCRGWGEECEYLNSFTQYTCTESLLYAKHCIRYCRSKDEQDTVHDLKEFRVLNVGSYSTI